MELPSGGDFEDVAELALSLAETADEWPEWAWEDVLEAIVDFCNHPAVIFASRACDLIRSKGEE